MYLKFILGLMLTSFFLSPSQIFGRVTPNDIYQQKQEQYQTALAKITDPAKKKAVEQANQMLKDVNQLVCQRFDTDINKMGAILDELKRRQGINKTVVAYGQGDTPLDQAEYYLNYAAEAVAYQKSQDYTPNISGGNLKGGVTYSMSQLSGNLNVLQGKLLKAKAEVGIALNYYNEK